MLLKIVARLGDALSRRWLKRRGNPFYDEITAVADAFLKAMRVYGVPSEVLTDNGKQFTGKFTRPLPVEVLFDQPRAPVWREDESGG